jgi:hypothetical protein
MVRSLGHMSPVLSRGMKKGSCSVAERFSSVRALRRVHVQRCLSTYPVLYSHEKTEDSTSAKPLVLSVTRPHDEQQEVRSVQR